RTLEAAGGRLQAALDARQAPAQRRDGGARRLGVGAALVGGRLVTGDVSVEDGAIRAVGLAGSGDRVAVAGLVDLQVNGYAGIDALSASEDELAAMGAALARDGVLAYQPTLITSDPAVLRAATARIGALARRAAGPARILGVHLEGPFLSPGRAGTHPVAALRSPDGALAAGLVAAGPVTMVTLAPELPGGLELVASLVARGVRVALGHSAASAEVARLAADAGASAVTHLFNAMSPVTARAPGLVAAALVDRRLAVQVIADGVHVADDNLRLAFAAAPGRCSIVTDATSLARAVASARTLGEVTIAPDGGVARRADGTIAGGTTPLVAALRHLVEIGVGLEDALAAATERPARLLGRDDVGRLRLGAPADVVVLDGDLRLAQVLAAGRTVDPAQ
ncbi:MAG: amidohydrolase family protein, partial [Actinomycetota bacterium]|nr:amidohydrolase family protein [Actinomycetota bacterium]